MIYFQCWRSHYRQTKKEQTGESSVKKEGLSSVKQKERKKENGES